MAPLPPIGFDNPQVRFITYCDQTFGVGTVSSCSIQFDTPISEMPSKISFGNGVSALTQQTVINVATQTPSLFGGWVPLALPDTNGFRHDVTTDANAPQFPLALLFAYVVSDPSLSYADRKTFATLGQSWITAAYPTQAAAIIAQIKTYATNRWIPIV